MAFQPAPQIIRLVINQTLLGSPVANVLHAFHPGVIAPGDVAFLAEAVYNAWRDNVLPDQSSNLLLNNVQAYSLDSVDGPTATYASEINNSGGQVVESMSSNVAYCISLRTGVRGGTGRGRVYLAGIPTSAVVGNLVVASESLQYRAGVQAVVDAINATFNTAVVLSRRINSAPRANAVGYAITSVIARDLRVDTQRRRLPDA